MAMDHDTAMTWSEQLPEETLMAPGNEDDFSNFLEFGIDFPDMEGHNAAAAVAVQHQHQQAMQHANQHIATTLADDVRMAATSQAPQYTSMMGEHLGLGIPNNRPAEDQSYHFSQEQQQQQQQQYHQQLSQQQQQHQEKLAHQHRQHQHQRQQIPHPQMASHSYQEGQHMIPPTPNSVELHGGAARYMQRVDQNNNDAYEGYVQMNDEQVTQYITIFEVLRATVPGPRTNYFLRCRPLLSIPPSYPRQ